MHDDFGKFGNSIGLGLFLLVVIIIGILIASGKIDFFGWANNMIDNSFESTTRIVYNFV